MADTPIMSPVTDEWLRRQQIRIMSHFRVVGSFSVSRDSEELA